MTAVDFLLRRTGWILFDRQKTERTLASVMRIMREYLEWNHEELGRQWELLQDQLQLAWGVAEGSRMERFTDPPDREDVTGSRSDQEAEHSSAVSAMNR
jgi:glycerol-3-phosphate dehydrogenase